MRLEIRLDLPNQATCVIYAICSESARSVANEHVEAGHYAYVHLGILDTLNASSYTALES